MAFDPLSATAETAILADVAAPAVASEAIIPSILTGIGGIGATDAATIAAAGLAGAAPGTLSSSLAAAGLSNLATPVAANALNIAGMGGQLAANAPSVLSGIGGIGAGDTSALASALGGATPGTVGSTLSSSGLSDLASLTPGATDTAAATTNAGIPSGQFDFNVANAAPNQSVNLGQFKEAVPTDQLSTAYGNTGDIAKNLPTPDLKLPPSTDILGPSSKMLEGAKDAQGILGKMGLGGLEDFYNKNKLLSNIAVSGIMGGIGSKQPGVAPIKKYSGLLNKYHLASDFQSTEPTQGIYKPSYTQNLAEGGIARYAKGSTTSAGGQVYYDPQKGQYYTLNSSTNNSYAGPMSMYPGFLGLSAQDTIDNRSYITPKVISGSGSASPSLAAQIYHAAYQTPTQPQTNVPVSAAQADPGLWNESMYTPMFADGGIASYGLGGDVNANYPQAHQDTTQFANQNQLPTTARNMQYEPKTDPMTGEMIGFASGGVTGYADGDLVELADPKHSNPLLDYYSRHSKAKEMMAKPDVGVFYDTDPDTRHLDALQAAQTRLKKQFGYAQMNQPKTNLNPMPSLGTLPGAQQQAIEAASGGIMGYSLGGYATGGNPRLLKGPGDGMSDNIPATIADRQPARLADGEFVVPADVVSHLGNGSTDAGAKKLHGMMDKVRVARTGKKKQGTQINPNKFLPA